MGLARLVGRGSEPERPDERVLGSVDYLSPEQALGTPGFDHRADIYSLGCTFYFLLTGHPPFPDGTLPERILKHQTQQPRSIRSQRPNMPPELVDICAKMMAKRPEDRFQLAAEISRRIAAVEVGESIEGGRSAVRNRARRGQGRSDARRRRRKEDFFLVRQAGVLRRTKAARRRP